jgi:Protein of unknown function (DUF3822)
LKIAFKIPPIINDISTSHLLVEACADEISFLIYSQYPIALEGVYIYQFEKNIDAVDYAIDIKKIIAEEKILQHSFASIHIYYNFTNATLIPNKYFVEAEKENVLDVMFGINKSTYCFYEGIKDNGMKIVYRIPSKIYETMNEVFPKNKFSHATSSQLQKDILNGDKLSCIVYHNCIKIILVKENQIQIVQFFDYEMPIDVSYHLLNVCERFKVSPSTVQLSISGMIDEKSNLYDDIHKYFLNIYFATLPSDIEIAESMKALPLHFYSNLTALAQCEL